MPFSAVLTHHDIYQLFYDDYENQKSFFHSHTYSGNALAASIALEVLTIMQEDKICVQAEKLGGIMRDEMMNVANKTGCLTNVRQLGAMVAADIVTNSSRRIGFEISQQAVQLGALLRPLGNTIYWLPPLTTDVDTIKELSDITTKAILKIC
jgi:adenosylmethionine-8-amino-7-oxononanoate aminotransferase